jgi:Methyltransferase domain
LASQEQAHRNSGQFVWDTIQSVEELGSTRMYAMQAFLDDYDLGKRQGRYVDAELPSLTFPDKSFDLAVCSHFLFLYTQHLSKAYHRSAIRELCRVASEVRIFPLLALDGSTSLYFANIVDDLRTSWNVSLETVPYEFQRSGNQMMRVRPLQTEHPRM